MRNMGRSQVGKRLTSFRLSTLSVDGAFVSELRPIQLVSDFMFILNALLGTVSINIRQ